MKNKTNILPVLFFVAIISVSMSVSCAVAATSGDSVLVSGAAVDPAQQSKCDNFFAHSPAFNSYDDCMGQVNNACVGVRLITPAATFCKTMTGSSGTAGSTATPLQVACLGQGAVCSDASDCCSSYECKYVMSGSKTTSTQKFCTSVSVVSDGSGGYYDERCDVNKGKKAGDSCATGLVCQTDNGALMCTGVAADSNGSTGTLPNGVPCAGSPSCQSGSCIANTNGDFVCAPSGSTPSASADTPEKCSASGGQWKYDTGTCDWASYYGTSGGTGGATGGTVSGSGSCAGKNVAGVCFPTGTGLPDPSGGVKQIITNLLNWLLGIFTAVAIIAFIISGVQYLTSAGDEDRLNIAKRNAKWSLVGVVIGLSGFVIIQAINSALTASSTAF